jgi:hypothetical protein
VKNQTNPNKLCVTQPWAMAFEHKRDEAYVVRAAGNHPSRSPWIRVPERPPCGKHSRGIVINSAGSRAYVASHVSRDVSVIDLSAPREP